LIDEHKLLRDSSKSAQAQELLDNALFNEALATIEADLIAAWKATPARDQEGRERCWNALQQASKIKGYFESVIRDGKLASAQLKELAEDAERKRRFSR
jgi:hypothetical protein